MTNAPPLDVVKAMELTATQLVIQHDAICNQARRVCPELVDAYEALMVRYLALGMYKETGEWKI